MTASSLRGKVIYICQCNAAVECWGKPRSLAFFWIPMDTNHQLQTLFQITVYGKLPQNLFKNTSRTIVQGVIQTSKFLRSQFHWASLWYTRTSSWWGLCGLDLALTLRYSHMTSCVLICLAPGWWQWVIWVLWMSCEDVPSCTHSCIPHWSLSDMGNFESRFMLWVCHIIWDNPEQSWTGVHQYSKVAPCRC